MSLRISMLANILKLLLARHQTQCCSNECMHSAEQKGNAECQFESQLW